MDNSKQFKILAEVFNTDKIITSDEIEQVLKGILQIMDSFKKKNETLNKETKEIVENLLNKVVTEHEKSVSQVTEQTEEAKEYVDTKLSKHIEEIVAFIEDIKENKPLDGKDADEDLIVESVLAKIKLPEYKEVVLDNGEEIVDKINALSLKETNQIDAKHIKNLPKNENFMVGGSRYISQMADVAITSIANNDTLKWNSTTNRFENGAGGGGYTNLTQFVDQTAWRVFYSNGSGDVTELALGADGTFLKSNGAAVAPSFATPAGAGDMVLANAQTNSGIKTFLNTTMKLRNVANTFDGYFVNTNTADRIYTLKDAAGTIAFTSDITGTNSGTNTGDQTSIIGITGTKAQFNTAVTDGDIVYLDSVDAITGVKTMSGLNVILVASSGLTIRNPADTFKYTITGAAIAADRVLNLPLITGADTLGALGLVQTWTAVQTFVAPVLGTPTSATLTNATGLPLTGLVSDTTTAVGVGSLNVGHASDTTIVRSGAGIITVEAIPVLLAGSSTVGQIPRITAANTYAWGALDLADTDAVTGLLPIANIASYTRTLDMFNSGLVGDATGDAFFEPYSILATNDLFRHLILRCGANNAAAPTVKAGVYGKFHVPNDYNTGGTVTCEVYWTTTLTTGDVVWDLDYRAIGGDDTESLDQATFQEALTVTDTAPSAVNERQLATMTFTASNLAVGDTVEFFFGRDGAAGGDTLAGSALVHEVIFKYTT